MNMTSTNHVPGDILGQYLHDVRRFPLLTADQERDLTLRWQQSGDEAALRLLVGSHLRLVVKMARQFSGYGLPMTDLIAEGNIGLMQAVTKFDAERGFRFGTYASWWIRASIQEYVLHNWSLVKIGTTAAQKKLFFNLRRLRARLQELEDGDLSPETVAQIATELQVPRDEVVNMNRRLGGDWSLNAFAGSEDSTVEWQDLLVDQAPSQEHLLVEEGERSQRRRWLEEGLGVLNDRERVIVTERRLKDDPATLEELGQRFSVSRERIRQIEARAFEKLEKAIKAAAANDDPAAPAAA